MRGTWQTSNHGSSRVLLLVLVIIGLAIAAGSGAADRAVHDADELVHVVLITVVVLAGAAVAGLAGLIVWSLRANRQLHGPVMHQAVRHAPPRVVQAPAAAQNILPPQIHLHLHGPVSAADVAELIARQGQPQPAIEKEHQ